MSLRRTTELPFLSGDIAEIFPRRFDWALASAVLLLGAFGVLAVASAGGAEGGKLALRQLLFLGAGAMLMVVLARVDYRTLVEIAPGIWATTLVVLAGTIAFAPTIAGTKAWIPLLGFRLQPSEFARIATILVLSRLLGDFDLPTLDFGTFARICVFVGAPMVLVAGQNDLGMAATFGSLALAGLFVGGLRLRTWLIILGAGVLMVALVLVFALQGYQRKRIETFLNPESDPKGAGYQVQQSKIAIGSGGMTGKGYGHGTQSGLGFLPARHTDFIFAVVAEELGFLGVLSLLTLLGFVVLRLFAIARRARDRSGAFLPAAFAFLLCFHIFINAGMLVGLVPMTGITMPFLSYGGSSLVSNMIGIGLALSVEYRRFANV